MTLVLDSNVLLSALAGHSDSPSAKLLAGIRAGSVRAVACPRLITELREGLEAIVTGDKDLLDHADLEPPAWSPKTACAQLGLP